VDFCADFVQSTQNTVYPDYLCKYAFSHRPIA